MKVNRLKLVSILKKCLPGIEMSSSMLDGADTFVFVNGSVHSYNDTISISVPLEEDLKELTGSVKAIELFNLLNKLTIKEFKLVNRDNKWIIKSGTIKIELNLIENTLSDYVSELGLKNLKWKKVPENFIEGLKICRIGCNNSTYEGVYAKDNILTALDGSRINWFQMKSKICNFWVSNSSVNEILKFENVVEISESGNSSWLHFKTDVGVCFSCRKLVDENYPFDKIAELIEKYSKEKIYIQGVLPDGFTKAVNRASSLSMNLDSEEVVKVVLSKTGIDICSERPTGSYKEKIKWEKEIKPNFPDLTIYLNESVVAYAANRATDFQVKKINKKDGEEMIRVILYNENFQHCIAPVIK